MDKIAALKAEIESRNSSDYAGNGYVKSYINGLKFALDLLTVKEPGDRVSNGAEVSVGSVVGVDWGYCIKVAGNTWKNVSGGDVVFNDDGISGVLTVRGQ